MKILSRPPVKQACEDIVRDSLQVLCKVRDKTEPMHHTPSLMEYCRSAEDIMHTLQVAEVLKTYYVGEPKETANSTYKNEEWVLHIGFSSDNGAGYTAELRFNFRREVP
jgi:hypothetical protein